MTPPHAVITGATRGIGFEIARGLYAAGYTTTLVCRDAQAGAAVRSGLGDRARLEVCDLSRLEDVLALGARLREGSPIDVLMHNAGLWPSQRELVGAYERAFVVNHLAPFLLTRTLEASLERSSARIVQVAAGLMVRGRADLERTPSGLDFSSIRTYADTKLCNFLVGMAWSQRLQRATWNAVHPGVVRTNLGARSGPVGWLLRGVKRFWLTPEQGARGPLHLATSAELAGCRGMYYDQMVPTDLPEIARDLELRAALWAHAMSSTPEP